MNWGFQRQRFGLIPNCKWKKARGIATFSIGDDDDDDDDVDDDDDDVDDDDDDDVDDVDVDDVYYDYDAPIDPSKEYPQQKFW